LKHTLEETSDAARQPLFSARSRLDITHRCHRNAFLLKFARDRRRYLLWVFEAKKRFGLSALTATSQTFNAHRQ
jgi:hypothetical protein